MAKHNEIGKIGEDIAVKWLISKNYSIIERNYWKKFGEIDIVARVTKKVHFIEVKSVSYETKDDLKHSVSHETWRPEENVHKDKIRRFKNVIEAWLSEHNYNGEWQINIITVRLVSREKFAQVNIIENVVFE
jgi:putative endonuclease